MSLIGRRSGGPSFDAGNVVQRNSVERVSLSAAPMDGETRFSERGGASGSLNDSLLGPDGEPVFDPTARESALEEHGWVTRAVYGACCLRWHARVFDRATPMSEQMYRFHNVGLYCHYAAVGLGYGIQGLAPNFCFYYYGGDANVCNNAQSMVFLAWGLKIFYAVVTDRYRPCGTRRRAYMIAGWVGTIALTALLGVIGDTCTVGTWLGVSIATQACMMLADVPADGYSVELGQLERPDERGVILSTGQVLRFASTMFAGVVQALLVNGTKTNAAGCPVDLMNCWPWGLTVAQYYQLLALLLAALAFPIFFLREIACDHVPVHTFAEHAADLWVTMQNPTTLYLLVFVAGNAALSQIQPATYNYVQYTLVQLTNFQAGVQTVFSFLATAVAVKIFQVFFRNRNWRTTMCARARSAALLFRARAA